MTLTRPTLRTRTGLALLAGVLLIPGLVSAQQPRGATELVEDLPGMGRAVDLQATRSRREALVQRARPETSKRTCYRTMTSGRTTTTSI